MLRQSGNPIGFWVRCMRRKTESFLIVMKTGKILSFFPFYVLAS